MTTEEIEKIAKMMRIELDPSTHDEHVERVKQCIHYFELLDKADVEDEEIVKNQTEPQNLRKDEHIPYGQDLLNYLKHYKNGYIRAPNLK